MINPRFIGPTKRWAVRECWPGSTGPGDPIEPDCIVVAKFWTRRGAVQWLQKQSGLVGMNVVHRQNGEWQ